MSTASISPLEKLFTSIDGAIGKKVLENYFRPRWLEGSAYGEEAAPIGDRVANLLPIIIAAIDEDGMIVDCCGGGLKPLGLSAKAARGRNVFAIPDSPVEAIRQAMRGLPVTCVWTWVREGTPRHFECQFRLDAARKRRVVVFAQDVTDRIESECALERHRQILTGLLQHLPVIGGRLDTDGNIREVGGSGLAESGLTPAALEGARFADLFPDGRHVAEQALAGTPGRFETLLNPGGPQELYVEFRLFFDSGERRGAVFFGEDVTRRRSLEQEILHAVDAERQRLGADLHDELGQLLTGIACLSTALVERLRGCDDLAAEEAATIADIGRKALDETRSLARGLAPLHLSHRGLPALLGDLRAHVQRTLKVDLSLQLSADTNGWDHEVSAHLFRIAQEAVTNAVRHGHATAIDVSLIRTGGAHRLTIMDNGNGFDPQQPCQTAGSGLVLMEYRAALIGGRLRIFSDPGTGTRIEIRFQLNDTYRHENAS